MMLYIASKVKLAVFGIMYCLVAVPTAVAMPKYRNLTAIAKSVVVPTDQCIDITNADPPPMRYGASSVSHSFSSLLRKREKEKEGGKLSGGAVEDVGEPQLRRRAGSRPRRQVLQPHEPSEPVQRLLPHD